MAWEYLELFYSIKGLHELQHYQIPYNHHIWTLYSFIRSFCFVYEDFSTICSFRFIFNKVNATISWEVIFKIENIPTDLCCTGLGTSAWVILPANIDVFFVVLKLFRCCLPSTHPSQNSSPPSPQLPFLYKMSFTWNIFWWHSLSCHNCNVSFEAM